MKKFEIYGVSALLGATLAMGVASCSSSDPATEEKTTVVYTPEAPKVEVNNIISGIVTDMSGEALKGAKVVMDKETFTVGEDGTYSFEKVSAGNHTLEVSAEGKIAQQDTITVAELDNGNHVLNFALANEPVKLEVKEDGSQEGQTETETLKDNDAAKIEVVVEAPAEAVEVEEGEEQPEITITPTYSAEANTTAAAKTRADDDNRLFLIGSEIACSKKDAKLKKSLSLTYNVDPEMLKEVKPQKYVNGKWVDVKSSTPDLANGTITIEVDEFASYGLFCTASMSAVELDPDPLTFKQDTWDNTKGTSTITAEKAEYSYKVGTAVSAQKDKVLAYLVEMLVRATGAGLKTMDATYPLNVKLEQGTGLQISGTQKATRYTAKLGNKSVEATKYGSVTFTTKTWAVEVKREHTGGGSK